MRSVKRCAAMSMRGGSGGFPDRQSTGGKMFVGIGGGVTGIRLTDAVVGYMDYSEQKKYRKIECRIPFIIGCIVYFLAVIVRKMLNYHCKRQKGRYREIQKGRLWENQKGNHHKSQKGRYRKSRKGNHHKSQKERLHKNRKGRHWENQKVNHCESRKEKYRKTRKETRQESRKALFEMYRISREVNRWRHDMLAEISVLYRMQKNGKYQEAEAYMEKLCSRLKEYPELPQPTGNDGLDAALMEMVSKCTKKGVRFCYVILRKPERMDGIAMGKLMYNLLCNSLEACQELTGAREIDLVVEEQRDGLEICLENSIGESVLDNNPGFISSKKEKERHGFGMECIGRIVEEYGGTYEYWEEKRENDNRFCQRIYLAYRQG